MDTSTGSGRGRGDRRNALLNAAIQLFGAYGFDAVTIRAVAERAGVNTAMISYYFGGKDKLYEAAIGFITSDLARVLESPLTDAERFLIAAPLDRDRNYLGKRSVEHMHALLKPLIRLVCAPETTPRVRLILREHQDPSPAFRRVYVRFFGRIMVALTGLLGCARGRTVPNDDDRLSAITLVGQIMVFRVVQGAVMMQMDWDGYNESRIGRIERCILNNLSREIGVRPP
jgi:AcrR family transcriptional regulator